MNQVPEHGVCMTLLICARPNPLDETDFFFFFFAREANVDEVFVDLCRQMLRKDDDYLASIETDDSGFKFDAFRSGHKRKRRMRLGEKDHPRCVIL